MVHFAKEFELDDHWGPYQLYHSMFISCNFPWFWLCDQIQYRGGEGEDFSKIHI